MGCLESTSSWFLEETRPRCSISKHDRWKRCPERTWKLTWPRKRRRYRDESSDWQPANREWRSWWKVSLDRSNWPLRWRLFTSLLSLGWVEKAGEGGGGRKVLRRWSREVHKSRLQSGSGGAAKRVSSVYIGREFVAKKREKEREREAKNNPLVRACIESTYVCTRPRRGQASFAERPRVPPPPTFPSWFAIVMQICQGDSRFLRHDLECLHPLN